LLIHEKFTVKEVLWTFSIYLEAVAILPQLVLLQRTRNIDNLTGQYVFLLGAFVPLVQSISFIVHFELDLSLLH
ncbi:ER lumen protein-retaining receptor, partial [Tanacetum coccineum]